MLLFDSKKKIFMKNCQCAPFKKSCTPPIRSVARVWWSWRPWNWRAAVAAAWVPAAVWAVAAPIRPPPLYRAVESLTSADNRWDSLQCQSARAASTWPFAAAWSRSMWLCRFWQGSPAISRCSMSWLFRTGAAK